MLQVARLGIARFSLSRFFATYFLHFALIFLNSSNLGKTKLRKMFRLSKHCYWTYIKKKDGCNAAPRNVPPQAGGCFAGA